ncbi:hypothetical protein Pyn_33669 [Prunus yedoensis var. nudiflora]|uniref:Uncharacterized protein n=1 Tax=Prunus yedoensis var. nudiflora TaxID=2094558 RepID=A0A314YYE2_PRUYE|nr:hypothetical protein Pyn_33669 [Prunus yedoensis var. nudiflora]
MELTLSCGVYTEVFPFSDQDCILSCTILILVLGLQLKLSDISESSSTQPIGTDPSTVYSDPQAIGSYTLRICLWPSPPFASPILFFNHLNLDLPCFCHIRVWYILKPDSKSKNESANVKSLGSTGAGGSFEFLIEVFEV